MAIKDLLGRRAPILAVVGLVFPASAHASGPASLGHDAPGAVLRAAPARGSLRFAHTRRGVRGISGPSDASRFLQTHGSAFGLAPNVEARAGATSRDALGHTRVDFDAFYRGVPVFGGRWSLHFDASDALVAVRAAFVPSISVSEIPGFSAAEAELAAVDAVPGATSVHSGAALFIFDRGLVTGERPDPRLAYRVVVEGPGQRHEVFIDAHSSETLLVASRIHQELDRRVYDAVYDPSALVWEESDGPYLGGDAEIEDLIAFTEDTYALYENISGGTYLSYDGASAPMEGVVHFDFGGNCPNASWNGTSTNYCNGLVTDDVVAHEWAHAYTQRNHELIYAYQPGALNESYSDIFGEAVDLLNESGDGPHGLRNDGACAFGGASSERWLIGEETVGLGGAIRDMWNPTCFDHPGRTDDVQYVCTGDDFFDNGGVHFNSGVPNHAFALLVDGGASGGQVVPAIGMTKALAIYWRAMTVYQGVTSGFADHADALLASCDDLVAAAADLPDPVSGGPSGEVMSAADCTAVGAAIDATTMLDDPGCGSGTLLDPSDPPGLCGGDNPSTLLEATFEAGLDGWTLSHEGVFPTFEPRDWELVSDLPQGREGQAIFATGDLYLGDCATDDESGVLHVDSPSFAMPNGEGDVVLRFRHYVATQPGFDGGNLKVSLNGGPFTLVPSSAFGFNEYTGILEPSENPLSSQPAFTGSDPGVPTGTWASSLVDLHDVAEPGDDVVLRFDFGIDGCNGLFGWYVDDVEVLGCGDVVDPTTTGVRDTDDEPSNDTSSSGEPMSGTAADESTTSSSGPDSDTQPDGSESTAGTDAGPSSGSVGSDDEIIDRGCACAHRREDAPGWTGFLLSIVGLRVLRRRRRSSCVARDRRADFQRYTR